VVNINDLFGGNESSGGMREFMDIAGKNMGAEGPMTNAPQGVPVMLKQAWDFKSQYGNNPMRSMLDFIKSRIQSSSKP